MTQRKTSYLRARVRLDDHNYPKPVADWLNPAEYPTDDPIGREDPSDPLLASKAWAWQFLRRSESYQRAWDELRRSNSSTTGVAAQFGLSIMIPFADDAQEYVPFIGTLGLRTLDLARPQQFLANCDDSSLIVALDLRRPLKFQLRLLRSQFEEERARRSIQPLSLSRKHTASLSRYLRILDAKASGAKNEQIAQQLVSEKIYSNEYRSSDVFYVAQSCVEQDVNTARHLANVGYLGLIHS